MSERVSFLSRAMRGRSLGTVRSVLKRRGVNLADDIKWKTSREMTDQLEKQLRTVLADTLNPSLESGLNSQVRAEVTNAVSRPKSILKYLESTPILQAFAEQQHADELKSLRSELAGMDHALIKVGGEAQLLKSAACAQSRLEALASNVLQELCQVEREATLEIVSNTLSGLGYFLKSRSNSLQAILDQTCVLARINDSGELSLDLSGFSGLSCLQEMNKIELEFKRRGLVLERTFSKFHGEPGTEHVTCEPVSPLPDFQRVKTKNPLQGTLQWETTKVGG